MRLNFKFGTVMLLMSTAAFGATQLTNVNVNRNGGTTMVAIHANGAFTHTEYRPTDNLLLVDLAGVSAAKLDNSSKTLHMPGVESYRVVGYKGANGAEIARVELTLAPGAAIKVADGANAVSVAVTGGAETTEVAETKPQPVKVAGKIETAERATAGQVAQIKHVTVARGRGGMNVEISATGAIEPKVITLTGPDRIVIDVANSIPAARPRQFAVHSGDVKMVRMSRFQMEPPVTRIVVDLNSAQQFEMAGTAAHPVIKLHPAMMETVAAVAPAPAPAVVESKPVPVMPPATQAETPAVRAIEAASHFGGTQPKIELTNANAMLAKPTPAVNAALQQRTNSAAATPAVASAMSCNTGRYTGEPISVNLKDVDLRDFFRLIHEISGLNVVLDPNVKGSLTIVLDDVPWDQALNIVLQNNGLDCQLQGNVLRIATTKTLKEEADSKRAQIEAQALAVEPVTINRYLSYANAKDVVPTIKQFLSARGSVISDDRTNSLVIQDIPSVIPNVDRLLKELDRKTQEVEIEARVVAATRTFARDIGTQLGFGWGNNATAVGGNTQAGTSSIFASPRPGVIQIGQPTAPAAGQPVQLVQIPLFSNLAAVGPTSGFSFLNAGANYRLDFILTAAENRGLLKILSRPRVVTQNNIQALVKQGLQIPIVTAAQLGGPPTVTYVPAFLRLQVKPQITAEGTIFLNVDVENTVPDFGRAVQGNPTLVTQQATTQVLVTDGGTVVIGGVIQTQSNVQVQQVPLLGDIPVFGNLFKRRAVSTSTQELIFFITPKIIQT